MELTRGEFRADMAVTRDELRADMEVMRGEFRDAVQDIKSMIVQMQASMDQRFMRQFAYFEKKFENVDQRLDTMATKQQLEDVMAILDGNRNKLDGHEAEITALNSQTARHEVWIHKIAVSMARYLKMS